MDKGSRTGTENYDSARVDGIGILGEVVSVSDKGVTVQANGGRILIERVRANEGKVTARVNKAGITAGMKMGRESELLNRHRDYDYSGSTAQTARGHPDH